MTPHALRHMKHDPPPSEPRPASALGPVLWAVLGVALGLLIVLPLLRHLTGG